MFDELWGWESKKVPRYLILVFGRQRGKMSAITSVPTGRAVPPRAPPSHLPRALFSSCACFPGDRILTAAALWGTGAGTRLCRGPHVPRTLLPCPPHAALSEALPWEPRP